MFNFDNTFEIHDDIEVLKRMGMAYGLESGSCSDEDLKTAQSILPPALKPFVEGIIDKLTNKFVSSKPIYMRNFSGLTRLIQPAYGRRKLTPLCLCKHCGLEIVRLLHVGSTR